MLSMARSLWIFREAFLVAEKQYLLGNRARELLIYTNQATKISSGDVSSTAVKKLIHQIVRAEDLQQVKAICDGLEKALGKNASHGFSKSAYRCYGEDMRMIAKGIVRDIRSANSKRFEVEYEERLRLIQSVLDGCGLLLDYIQICLELNIVSTQKAAVWTKKVQDVNYMTLAWRKTDAARADGLRQAGQKAAEIRIANIVRKALREGAL